MPPADDFDFFLSHATADKPWVRTLHDELAALGLRAYLDERELHKEERGFVVGLGTGLDRSRFLALVLSRASHDRPWVVKELSEHMAAHGPFRVFNVMLDDVPMPPMNRSAQAIDAKHRDAHRVAAELLARVGRAGDLSAGDGRALLFSQDLAFTLAPAADGPIALTIPDGTTRPVAAPADGFAAALRAFRRLVRDSVDGPDHADLFRAARHVGDALFALLFGGRMELWQAASRPGRGRPLLRLLCDVDEWLAWPWELLHHDGAFLVREGRLDITRTTTRPLDVPAAAERFRLVVNVSAPRGKPLSYEDESYRLTRALSERCDMVPTELGTLDDLAAVYAERAPAAVHFSGHGGPGVLEFEDEYGDGRAVTTGELLPALRRGAPGGRLPSLFFLACCHGNDPAGAGEASTAAMLHREGVPRVLAYHGPIGDALSTRAEEALYAALAGGETASHAVALARAALLAPPGEGEQQARAAGGPGGAAADPFPFAWSQLVFYHAGLDVPLAPRAKGRRLEATAPERDFFDPETQRRLKSGFIGRRTDLHRVRRRLRDGGDKGRVFVLQGLGGLGKSTLAFRMPALLGAAEGEVGVIWCQDTEQRGDQAAALVGQLAGVAGRRFGEAWVGMQLAIDRESGGDVVERARRIVEALAGRRLVLVLDNLESLLVGPGGGDFAAWRTDELRRLWKLLSDHATRGGWLTLIASCRYYNDDLRRALFEVTPLPLDAVYRLLSWFPALRRLSAATRGALARRLAGHPRAALFADRLIERRRDEWEEANDRAWRAGDEWGELVGPALPDVEAELTADLLLEAIWGKVLDEAGRRMLLRMTLLRRRWDMALGALLGEPDEGPEAAKATLERLRRTSLVEWEQDRERKAWFTLHPATAEFVAGRAVVYEGLRRATHLRVGTHLEAEAQVSRSIVPDIEGGHHLFEAGEYDRACELLGRASDTVRNWGQLTLALEVLKPFLSEGVQTQMSADRRGRLLGTVGNAYHALSQAERAAELHLQALEVAREIKDRRGEGAALGNLGLAYADLGQAERAAEFHLQHLEVAREIKDRRGEGAALGNLGLAYADLGQAERAAEFHLQNLEVSREIKDRRGEGAALGNLGLAYADLGQAERAAEFHLQRLAIAREIKDRRGEGNALGNLGLAYADLGQAERAAEFHLQHLEVAREIKDRRGEGAALGNLGLAYADLGQAERAITHHEAALAIGQEIKDPRIVRVCTNALRRLRGEGPPPGPA